MKIYKYQLEITDSQTLALPRGFKILSIQLQNRKLCLWASVPESTYTDDITFLIAGTGHETPEGEYIDTVQLDEFVFHVFYKE